MSIEYSEQDIIFHEVTIGERHEFPPDRLALTRGEKVMHVRTSAGEQTFEFIFSLDDFHAHDSWKETLHERLFKTKSILSEIMTIYNRCLEHNNIAFLYEWRMLALVDAVADVLSGGQQGKVVAHRMQSYPQVDENQECRSVMVPVASDGEYQNADLKIVFIDQALPYLDIHGGEMFFSREGEKIFPGTVLLNFVYPQAKDDFYKMWINVGRCRIYSFDYTVCYSPDLVADISIETQKPWEQWVLEMLRQESDSLLSIIQAHQRFYQRIHSVDTLKDRLLEESNLIAKMDDFIEKEMLNGIKKTWLAKDFLADQLLQGDALYDNHKNAMKPLTEEDGYLVRNYRFTWKNQGFQVLLFVEYPISKNT